MYDDQTPSGQDEDDGRLRGGRVRLSWLSREAAAFLAAAAIAAASLSARLDVDEPAATASVATMEGHDNLLEALALAPGRDVLISSGWDDTVRFWDVAPGGASWGEEVLSLPHESRPYALAPSPDGRYLAVGGSNHLTVWESGGDGWSPLASKQGTDYRYLAFAPDSRSLAIGGEGGDVRILAIPSMEETAVLKGLTDMVHSVAFSPDGASLAATSFRGELLLWDVKTGRRSSLEGDVGLVNCFSFSGDGRTLATAPRRPSHGGVTLWDLATGRPRATLGGGEGFNALAFSPDGELVAAACVDQTIKAWDARTGELRGSLSGDVGWVKTILFVSGGSRLAYGGRDGAIRFWELPAQAGCTARAPDSGDSSTAG